MEQSMHDGREQTGQFHCTAYPKLTG